MKQTATNAIHYFLYLGIAILLNPSNKSHSINTARGYSLPIKVEEKAVAMEDTKILHGELLFRY